MYDSHVSLWKLPRLSSKLVGACISLFERSEFLIHTSQKKNPSACARVPCAWCTCAIILVLVCTTYVRTWYQLVISRLPRYVYVSTYVPGWGTYYVPHTCRMCGIMYHIQKDCLGFSVGYQRAPGTSEKKKERLVPASASLPTAGSALPPVGRATPLLW